jgi:hypothetical protein
MAYCVGNLTFVEATNQRRFAMETPSDENRSVEPLMRPVEELERRAYPGESQDEIMRDENRVWNESDATPGILRGSPLPSGSGYPVPAPVPGKSPDEIEGDRPSGSWQTEH